jgi:hypothetical protein
MGKMIAAHAVVLLEVADDGLDGRAPSHVASDLRGGAAFLASGVDLELIFGRRVVSAVSGIGDDAIERVADDRLHGRDDGGERVAIIRVSPAASRTGTSSRPSPGSTQKHEPLPAG